jgi:hypothetical protein
MVLSVGQTTELSNSEITVCTTATTSEIAQEFHSFRLLFIGTPAACHLFRLHPPLISCEIPLCAYSAYPADALLHPGQNLSVARVPNRITVV